MAATRLIPLHQHKGKSVIFCLKNRTDYAQNPDKTEKGELISSYQCSPITVDEEFMLSKKLYEQIIGRRQKSNVIAYQIRQSFKPGEITAEEANKIGYELASRFLKGKHAFVVATHTDRAHIHNHIVFNSTALDGQRKSRNFWLSSFAIQKLSDMLCLEHQLSVIAYKPYRERQKRIVVLRTHIINYAKTRDVYAAYRKSGYSKKFLDDHREEITLHKAAKAAFDAANLKKLPKVKDLNAEYSTLMTKKKSAYPEYRKARDEMQELLRAQKNIELFFEEEKNHRENEQTR